MAQTYNLFLDQGATFKANVTIRDAAGDVRDISGNSARSQFRRSYISSNAFTFTATVPVGTDGNVFLTMNSDTTANVTAARYLYDIELVNDSNQEVERVAEGVVIVSPEITRI